MFRGLRVTSVNLLGNHFQARNPLKLCTTLNIEKHNGLLLFQLIPTSLFQAKRQTSMIQSHPPDLEELLELEEAGGLVVKEEERQEMRKGKGKEEKLTQKHPVNLFKRRHSVAPQHPVNSHQ